MLELLLFTFHHEGIEMVLGDKEKKKISEVQNQRADTSHGKNRNSTKSSTSIVHKLLQVVLSVSAGINTSDVIIAETCQRGLKIEAVTLTRKCKRSECRAVRGFKFE